MRKLVNNKERGSLSQGFLEGNQIKTQGTTREIRENKGLAFLVLNFLTLLFCSITLIDLLAPEDSATSAVAFPHQDEVYCKLLTVSPCVLVSGDGAPISAS